MPRAPWCSDHIETYLGDLVRHQYLLASATTEIGTGGDTRSSICAVEVEDGHYRLEKQAPVISYGKHADGILVTTRAEQATVHPARPGRQRFVLPPTSICARSAVGLHGLARHLQRWIRLLVAEGSAADVLSAPFGDIAAQTMLPVSHILWSHVWLGIATEALDRARRSVQAEARKTPGTTPPAALRLAELSALYDQMSALVHGAAQTFDRIAEDEDSALPLELHRQHELT